MWINTDRIHMEPGQEVLGYKFVYITAALNRFLRFMPFFEENFPETAGSRGIVESVLMDGDITRLVLEQKGASVSRVLIKADDELPIAGCVEGRGAMAELLYLKEMKKLEAGAVVGAEASSEDYQAYLKLAEALGYVVKDLNSTESHSETNGENDAAIYAETNAERTKCYLYGIAVAAFRLKVQLFNRGVSVNDDHHLFVYIPRTAGVVVAGLAFGLREVYGDRVHIFYEEDPAQVTQEIPGPKLDTCKYGELIRTLTDGTYTRGEETCVFTQERGILEVAQSPEFSALAAAGTHIIWAT